MAALAADEWRRLAWAAHCQGRQPSIDESTRTRPHGYRVSNELDDGCEWTGQEAEVVEVVGCGGCWDMKYKYW